MALRRIQYSTIAFVPPTKGGNSWASIPLVSSFMGYQLPIPQANWQKNALYSVAATSPYIALTLMPPSVNAPVVSQESVHIVYQQVTQYQTWAIGNPPIGPPANLDKWFKETERPQRDLPRLQYTYPYQSVDLPAQNNCFALQFDGSQNYVSLGTLGNFGSNLGNGFYFKFDIKTLSTAIGAFLADNNSFGANTIQLAFNIGSTSGSGKLRFTLKDNSGTPKVLEGAVNTPSINFNNGIFHTIIVSAIPTTNTITISIDGSSQTITYINQGTPNTFINCPTPLLIGAQNASGVANSFFACVLDNVQIGTSANNLYGLYSINEGKGTTINDSSGNNNNGTLTGSPLPAWVNGNCSSFWIETVSVDRFAGYHPDKVYDVPRQQYLYPATNVDVLENVTSGTYRRNLALNPSFEVSGKWSINNNNGGGTVTLPSSDFALFGSSSVKIVNANGTNTSYLSQIVNVQAGHTYKLSASVKVTNYISNFAAFRMYSTTFGSLVTTTFSGVQDWHQYSCTYTVPSNGVPSGNANQIMIVLDWLAGTYYYDGVLFEDITSTIQQPYFDGSLPFSSWEGATNTSISDSRITWVENTSVDRYVGYHPDYIWDLKKQQYTYPCEFRTEILEPVSEPIKSESYYPDYIYDVKRQQYCYPTTNIDVLENVTSGTYVKNLIFNPSYEGSVTPDVSSYWTSTLSIDTSKFVYGTSSLKVTSNDTLHGNGMIQVSPVIVASGTRVNKTSLWVWVPTGTSVIVANRISTPSFGFISEQQVSKNIIGNNTWQFVDLGVWSYSGGSFLVGIEIFLNPAQSGVSFWVDGSIISTSNISYFDGSLPFSSWEGTPNQSVSDTTSTWLENVSVDRFNGYQPDKIFDLTRDQYLYPTYSFDPIPFTKIVSVDDWHPKIEIPPKDILRNQYLYPNFIIDVFQLTQKERVQVDKWIGQKPDIIYDLKRQQFTYPTVAFTQVVPPIINIDRYEGYHPDFVLDVKRNQYLYPTFFQPQVFSITAIPQPVTFPVIFPRKMQYKGLTWTPIPITKEVITPDKWLGYHPDRIDDLKRQQYLYPATQLFIPEAQNNCFALQFDGSQNYVNLGTMGNFGSNLGNGFYSSFQLKTVQTSLAEFGMFDGKTGIILGFNTNEAGTNSSGYLGFILVDENGLQLRGGTTTSTNFNDGNIHTVVVTATPTTNTITISVDGSNKTITYSNQQTPSTFANFVNPHALGGRWFSGSFGNFLACTLDNFLIGTSATKLYGIYTFNEGTGTIAHDSSSYGNNGTLTGSPVPAWVQGFCTSFWNETVSIDRFNPQKPDYIFDVKRQQYIYPNEFRINVISSQTRIIAQAYYPDKVYDVPRQQYLYPSQPIIDLPAQNNCWANQFDGSQNYITLGTEKFLSGLTNAYFKAQFTSKVTSITSGGAAIYSERASTGNDIWKVDMYPTSVPSGTTVGQVGLTYRDDAGTLNVFHTTNSYNDGQPHTITIQKVGTAVTITVDLEVLNVTLTATNNFTNSGIETRIAGDNGDATSHFKGVISNLQIGSDQNTLFANFLSSGQTGVGTALVDNSGNGNNGTLTGSPLPLWVQGFCGTEWLETVSADRFVESYPDKIFDLTRQQYTYPNVFYVYYPPPYRIASSTVNIIAYPTVTQYQAWATRPVINTFPEIVTVDRFAGYHPDKIYDLPRQQYLYPAFPTQIVQAQAEKDYGVVLDGTEGFININNSSSLQPTSALTIAITVNGKYTNPSNAGGVAGLFVKDISGIITNPAYSLQIASGQASFLTTSASNSAISVASSTVLTDYTKHTIVGVFTGTTMLLYVDGILQGTAAQTDIAATTGNLYIGRQKNTFQRYFPGIVDNAAIWNRPLALSEIQGLPYAVIPTGLVGYWKLNEGTGTTATDSSGKSNNGTLSVNGSNFLPYYTTGLIDSVAWVEEISPDRFIPQQPDIIFDLKREQYIYPTNFWNTLATPERSSPDKWIGVYPDIVPDIKRQQYLDPNYTANIFPIPTINTFVSSWIGNHPDKVYDVTRNQYLYPSLTFVEKQFAEVISVDKWFKETEKPVWDIKHQQYTYPWFTIDTKQLIQPERVQVDKFIGYHPDKVYDIARQQYTYPFESRTETLVPTEEPINSESYHPDKVYDVVRQQYTYPVTAAFGFREIPYLEPTSNFGYHPDKVYDITRQQYTYPNEFRVDILIPSEEPIKSESNYPDKVYDVKRQQYTYPTFFADTTVIPLKDIYIDKFDYLQSRPVWDLRRQQYTYPSEFRVDQLIPSEEPIKSESNYPDKVYDLKRQQYTYPAEFRVDQLIPSEEPIKSESNYPDKIWDLRRQQYTYPYFFVDTKQLTQHERITPDKWIGYHPERIDDLRKQQFTYLFYTRTDIVVPPAPLSTARALYPDIVFDLKRQQYEYPTFFSPRVLFYFLLYPPTGGVSSNVTVPATGGISSDQLNVASGGVSSDQLTSASGGISSDVNGAPTGGKSGDDLLPPPSGGSAV